MKKQTSLICIMASAVVVVSLAIIDLIVRSFLSGILLHTGLRLFAVLAVIAIINKGFKGLLVDNTKKALLLCGIALTLDMVIVDAVRFILNGGISTVLFLPACLPICFMIIMLLCPTHSMKDSRKKAIAFLIGIPLLVLSVYLEVYSFIAI